MGLVGAALIALALARDAQAHVLTFTAARNAAQARADAYARQPTRIKTLTRLSFGSYPHLYYAQAEWHVPRPDIGVDEYHAIALRVRCLHAHTRANARRPCTPFAWVTDVFG